MANAVAHFTADLLSLRQTTNESLGLNERNIFLFNPNKNNKNMKKKKEKRKGKDKRLSGQHDTL
jgi:prophage tail gpP-like protein